MVIEVKTSLVPQRGVRREAGRHPEPASPCPAASRIHPRFILDSPAVHRLLLRSSNKTRRVRPSARDADTSARRTGSGEPTDEEVEIGMTAVMPTPGRLETDKENG